MGPSAGVHPIIIAQKTQQDMFPPASMPALPVMGQLTGLLLATNAIFASMAAL
jgi:hypothetical protein